MATNKELNDKVDKLTAMFEAMMLQQAAGRKDDSSPAEPKKRGRPSKKTLVQDNSEVEVTRRRRGRTWDNNFVDDGTEHVEDREIDKLLQVKPPIEKGTRKNPMIKSNCAECGKTEIVHRQLQFEGSHTCQKCLKNKAGK